MLGRKWVVDRLYRHILVSIEHQEDKRHHHVFGWLKMPDWQINGERLAFLSKVTVYKNTKHVEEMFLLWHNCLFSDWLQENFLLQWSTFIESQMSDGLIIFLFRQLKIAQ